MATDHTDIGQSRDVYPLLPLRGLLVYPSMVLHFDVGRPRSVRALEEAMVEDNVIVLASQEDGQIDEPRTSDLYRVGTLARVKQMLKLPNGTIRVLVEGLSRAEILAFVTEDEFFSVRVHIHHELDEVQVTPELQAMMRSVSQQFEQYVKLSRKLDQETYASVVDIDHPGRFADAVASHLPLKVREKQDILESFSIHERLERLLQILSDEREVLELERKIHQRVRKQMEKTQKEYYLREQMKAIQRELGIRKAGRPRLKNCARSLPRKSSPRPSTTRWIRRSRGSNGYRPRRPKGPWLGHT
ncbi:hypothetical protein GCM10025858_04300 [Alicyclobacillus sacchari]|nr:hypothetical protein GCM10025858_04300 [Alicyclobacillus sacchari]